MSQRLTDRDDPPSAPTIPVIDADGFAGTDWFSTLDTTCTEWGCFQLLNHGIDTDLIAATRRQIVAFFELPEARKLEIERSDTNTWGFFNRELTKNVRDWKEIFDFGPPSENPGAGSQPQWPADLPGFRETMENFYAACEVVAAKIVAGISHNLGMHERHLAASFKPEHTSFLRLNYYPVCDTPDVHHGINPHTDAGAVTVLLQDDVPALQFHRDGEWHTLAPTSDGLIVNIGDIVQVWSNDHYQAPLHRVLANPARERYSAPFFYNPSYAANYAPLAGVLNDQLEPRYRSINWGEFRAGRAAGDYADHGEEIQISQFRIQGT